MKINWKAAPACCRWNRLKSLRLERGLSQPEVAVGAGLSVGTIYHLELGHEERTTEEVKQKLCRFFDVNLEDLWPLEMLGNRPRAEVLAELARQPRRR